MRWTLRIALAATLCLTLAAGPLPTASAAALPVACLDIPIASTCTNTYEAPTGLSVCPTLAPGEPAWSPTCFTTSATDKITMTQSRTLVIGSIVGGEVYRGTKAGRTASVTCVPVTWNYERFHKYRSDTPFLTAKVETCSLPTGTYVVNGVPTAASPALVVAHALYYSSADAPNCDPEGPYKHYFYRYSVPAADDLGTYRIATGEATFNAPADYVAGCQLTRHVGGPPAFVAPPFATTDMPPKICTSLRCYTPTAGESTVVTVAAGTTAYQHLDSGSVFPQKNSIQPSCTAIYQESALPSTPIAGSCVKLTGVWENVSYRHNHPYNPMPYFYAGIDRFRLPDGRVRHEPKTQRINNYYWANEADCSRLYWTSWRPDAQLVGPPGTAPDHIAQCLTRVPRPSAPKPPPPTTTPVSTNPRPTTPTTSTSPVVCDDTCTRGIGVPSRRPSMIGGGQSSGPRGITWSSWDSQSATGAGYLAIASCDPDCATGPVARYPFTITLDQPRSCGNGVYAFGRARLSATNIADTSLIGQFRVDVGCPPAKPVPAAKPTRLTSQLVKKWIRTMASKKGAANPAIVTCRSIRPNASSVTCRARYAVGDGSYDMNVTLTITRGAGRKITRVSGRATGTYLDEYACYVTKTSCTRKRTSWRATLRV
jgi:hypothetical protein